MEDVVAGTAHETIIAAAAPQHVVTAVPVQRISPTQAADHIIASLSSNIVVGLGARKNIVRCRALICHVASQPAVLTIEFAMLGRHACRNSRIAAFHRFSVKIYHAVCNQTFRADIEPSQYCARAQASAWSRS